MSYLYCQNHECGVYLGSLGGEECSICGWHAPQPEHEDQAAEIARLSAALSEALAQLEAERARNAAAQDVPQVVGYLSKTGHGTYFRETITPALAELEWCGTPMWRAVAFVDIHNTSKEP